ncbi:hypothetical protein QBC32DRAFT_150767 [Pseudoneurospora amorphoporcata]|uniref:Uncharacterized protein n=1 Tax=Pseudoneurospora amorphoporcata TaxID=241081 RepID=A0AAN6NVX3_9PEZI|nr:hypothetical protein QBC32DRAFT_150767 [Pseudoneurospora amorphoporcata]
MLRLHKKIRIQIWVPKYLRTQFLDRTVSLSYQSGLPDFLSLRLYTCLAAAMSFIPCMAPIGPALLTLSVLTTRLLLPRNSSNHRLIFSRRLGFFNNRLILRSNCFVPRNNRLVPLKNRLLLRRNCLVLIDHGLALFPKSLRLILPVIWTHYLRGGVSVDTQSRRSRLVLNGRGLFFQLQASLLSFSRHTPLDPFFLFLLRYSFFHYFLPPSSKAFGVRDEKASAVGFWFSLAAYGVSGLRLYRFRLSPCWKEICQRWMVHNS